MLLTSAVRTVRHKLLQGYLLMEVGPHRRLQPGLIVEVGPLLMDIVIDTKLSPAQRYLRFTQLTLQMLERML